VFQRWTGWKASVIICYIHEWNSSGQHTQLLYISTHTPNGMLYGLYRLQVGAVMSNKENGNNLSCHFQAHRLPDWSHWAVCVCVCVDGWLGGWMGVSAHVT